MARPVVNYRSGHASAVAVLAISFLLAGCASIAKGVTEAVLEQYGIAKAGRGSEDDAESPEDKG